jgi:predicted dehydrogenase
MARKIRWGILSPAAIGMKKVIPAMQLGELCEVAAIASRDLARAQTAATQLAIPKAYSSYEALLADPEIDAVYNPLPNDLHALWSIKAAEAGKHVLCEKPIALDVAETRKMIAARDRTGVKMGEAFMVRTHPQWLKARQFVQGGTLGRITSVAGFFSYFNRDPKNIRNSTAQGGGALMDIGCYPITQTRFLLGEEPLEVVGMIDRDPDFGTDRYTSAMLRFPSAQATFTCGTQMVPYQKMIVFGTQARLEIQIPFNAPPGHSCLMFLDDGKDLHGANAQTHAAEACDQYTIQGDQFSRAILENREVAVPLEDALHNMAAIEAIFRSAKTGCWEKPAL